jgi:hypothetical protein
MLYLMWMDCSSDPLERRLQRAAAHFERKFGRPPSEAILPKGETGPGIAGLTLRESEYVLPQHIYLG